MCQKCTDEVAHLKPTAKFRPSREERANLPGKLTNNVPVSKMTPEEYQEHRKYRRAYQQAYNDFHAANGNGIKIYQDAYQKAYLRNHKKEKHEYITNYRKNNPEWSRKIDRRRRARHAQVESEIYSTNQILELWGTACYLCGEEIDLEANRGIGQLGWQRGLHLDHVIPIMEGGSDTVDNVRPTHALCNLRKSSTVLSPSDNKADSVKVLFKELYGDVKRGRPRLDSSEK